MSQYKNVIVIGNSFVENSIWPGVLFPDANICNLGKIAASNRYICDSIVRSIDTANPPDMVFIVWSSNTHIDIVLPNHSLIVDALEDQYHAELGDVCYFFTGGDKYTRVINNNYTNIKDSSWPDINTVADYLSLPDWIQQECMDSKVAVFGKNSIQEKIQNYAILQYLSGHKNLEDTMYTTMTLCHSFLQLHNIPYRFMFTVDPFEGRHRKKLGELTKEHHLYRCINWDNYVKLTFHEFGVEHNLLATDQFHLSNDGQVRWAEKIKSIL